MSDEQQQASSSDEKRASACGSSGDENIFLLAEVAKSKSDSIEKNFNENSSAL